MVNYFTLTIIAIVICVAWSMFFRYSYALYSLALGGIMSVVLNVVVGIVFALLIHFSILLIAESYSIIKERRQMVSEVRQMISEAKST